MLERTRRKADARIAATEGTDANWDDLAMTEPEALPLPDFVNWPIFPFIGEMRVRAPRLPSGAPVQVFLETREHVDMDGLDPVRAGELGQMIVRLDHAIQAVGGIGRVHLSRWGDGGSHFHMWFYGRRVGDVQMLGFCSAIWAME